MISRNMVVVDFSRTVGLDSPGVLGRGEMGVEDYRLSGRGVAGEHHSAAGQIRLFETRKNRPNEIMYTTWIKVRK